MVSECLDATMKSDPRNIPQTTRPPQIGNQWPFSLASSQIDESNSTEALYQWKSAAISLKLFAVECYRQKATPEKAAEKAAGNDSFTMAEGASPLISTQRMPWSDLLRSSILYRHLFQRVFLRVLLHIFVVCALFTCPSTSSRTIPLQPRASLRSSIILLPVEVPSLLFCAQCLLIYH